MSYVESNEEGVENTPVHTPEVVVATPTQSNGAEPIPEVRSGGEILSTAVNPKGGLITGALSDDCRVTVRGVEMTVAQAVSHGYLTKAGEGAYTEGNLAALDEARAAEAAEARAEAEAQKHTLSIDEEHMRTLTGLSAAVKQMGGNPIAVMSEFLQAPDKVPGVILDAIRAHGYETAEVQAEMLSAAEAVDKELSDYVVSKGVPAEEVMDFWNYVHKTVTRTEFTSAIVSVLFLGDARPFQKYVSNYVRSTTARSAPGEETVHNGQRREATTTLANGMRTTREAARRLGLRIGG